MQKDLELQTPQADKREVKYIKKFSKKMRILKLIIAIIALSFVAITGIKVAIISDLSNKAEKSIVSDNYKRTIYGLRKDDFVKWDIYNLGDKKKMVMTTVKDNNTQVRKIFATKEKDGEDMEYNINTYEETGNEKTAKLNTKAQISVDPYNTLQTENWWQLIIVSMKASIKPVTFDGQPCYYIANFEPSMVDGIYINKETGLLVGVTEQEPETTLYVYEFNTVTEKDFVEPDISEYKIEE